MSSSSIRVTKNVLLTRDKPLRKVLCDISLADTIDLDRWSLKVTRLPDTVGEDNQQQHIVSELKHILHAVL